MKLFTRYNSLSLTASVIIFALAITSLFFIVRQVLIRQLDASLLAEKDKVVQYVKLKNELPETVKVYDQRILFEEEEAPYEKFKFRTKYKEVHTEQDELVRALYFGVDLNSKHYKVTIIRSLNEMQRLLSYIIAVSIVTIALLLLGWFFINRFFIKKLLRPFYDTLSKMDLYRLSGNTTLNLTPTPVYEFKLLNEKITNLTGRIKQDYLVLKDFTGNAAHEMQTPLSIIRNQTDQLLQREGVTESEVESLQVIEETINKLSRLNQSLLLLAKLESAPFGERVRINLEDVIKKKLAERREIIHLREIDVEKTDIPGCVEMNESLAEIIVGNLLNNAIRFNFHGGKILVRVTAEGFSIANTSALPELDGDKIFQRFYRHPSSTSEGTGLGLAIVQQAITMAGFTITYRYKNALQTFTVNF